MTAIPQKSSKSFESSIDSWFPMPTSENSHEGSPYELQTLDRNGPVNKVKFSWRSLFVFTTRKHTLTIIVALISTIASSLLKPAAAIFFGNIFSSMTRYGAGTISIQVAVQQISKWCVALTALGVAAWLAEGVFLLSWMIFGELQAKSMREQIFTGMLDKNMEWYDLRNDGIGTLLIRIQTQIRELQLGVSQPMGFLVYEISASIASITLALYYSWNLTLVIIATFPVAALVLFTVSRNLSPAIEAQKRDLTLASKYANTAITSINTVKAFNGQDQEVWQYFTTIQNVASNYLIQARANAMQFGMIKFFTIGIFVQGFWYGLVLVNQGLDAGNVVTTFYACLTAMQAIEIVLPQWLVLTKGMSAGETLKSIMIQIKDNRKAERSAGSTRPASCDGDIEMNGISFAYPSNPRQDVLKNTTFFFPARESTFIVGRSGSGKSTLGNLLLKFYDPRSGEILIDGRPIDELDTDWLRQSITLVQQQSVLFNESIFQNIAFGKLDLVTTLEVWEAARIADLEKTLLGLADGLDTLVESNGKSLSGGQQQRVAIARARLRDAPILILDEATSALDHTSREKVNSLLREWRKGKTTIIITHDVSQILDDDYVYVLENGAVVQEGYRNKLAENFHGTFASFLLAADERMPQYQQRRNSEPASPTPPSADFPDDDFPPRRGYISTIFGLHESPHMISGNFGGLPGSRMSLGFGAAQVNDLRSDARTDAIWPTPQRPDVVGEFHSMTPKLPLKSVISPKLAPGPVVPTFSPIFDHESPPSSISTPVQPQATLSKSSRPLPRPLAINISVNDESGLDPIPTRSAAPIPPTPQVIGKPNSTTLKDIFTTIWPTLVWKERVVLILGFLAAFVVAASTPAFAYIFARLLGVFYTKENQAAEARKLSLTLLGIAVIDGTASFCYHYALEYTGQAWVNSLRVEALKRILTQPRSWFDKEKNSPSRLNECLDRNAEEMRNLIGRFAGPIFVAAWMLGISIVWSFTISWKLTLVALACAPVMYLATRVFDWVSSKWEDKCNHASDKASTIFTETFANIRVVRALTLETYFKNKHTFATKDTFRTGQSRAAYSGLLFGLTDSMSFFISALIFYYGIIIISQNELSIDKVLQVVQLLLFGIANASAAIVFVPQINNSRTTATQMLRLARLPLDTHESDGTRRLATPFPVQLNSLSFTYPSRSKTKTLSDINLTLKAGSCIALVGPSGSGKSTIASIILGLYPPDPTPTQQTPPLTFGGTSIEHCNTSSLRNYISIVPQAPTLFPNTILANIIYGLPEGSPFATISSATRAAQESGIHDFVMSLDQGYYTQIGEGGMGLSGGQAQRVAIARALVRKPRILILDEATSALDTVSAEAIRETVKKLVENRRGEEGMAVVTISHRVEMMRIADEIVMIEGGRVVERGSFEELRGKGGRLAELIGEKVVVEEEVGLGLREMTPVEARGKDGWGKGIV